VQGSNKKREYIYGPVPSRRLGFSLGVDLVPYKVCTYDCIYCQLGKTTKKTIQRKEYIESREVLLQIKKAISTQQKIDYITFSGSGEPTLNTNIGSLIREIKKITDIPVVVITNGSLLYKESIRKALLPADLVVPSLDAATAETFYRINRPHPSITFENVVKGLFEFRKEFKGKVWLEIMFIKDINDNKREIELLKSIIKKNTFDRIQLNTVVRPPSDKSAFPLSIEELRNIKDLIDENCEIISEFVRKRQEVSSEEKEKRILELIKRRPVTLSEISASLGMNRNEVIKYLDFFTKNDIIQNLNFKGKTYYESK